MWIRISSRLLVLHAVSTIKEDVAFVKTVSIVKRKEVKDRLRPKKNTTKENSQPEVPVYLDDILIYS